MPGKHAPDGPASFLLSLTRAGAGALAAVGLVVAIVVIAVSSRGDGDPSLAGTPGPTPNGEATQQPTTNGSPSTPDPEPTMTEPPIPRRQLTIEVLNGTNRTGLAASVAERMESAAYRRVEVGNAPSPAERTTIFYRGALEREARRLLRDLPELGRVRPARSGTPGDAQITVILGADHGPPG